MNDITEGYINRELEKFMDTTKGHYDGTKIDIDDFFDKYSG